MIKSDYEVPDRPLKILILVHWFIRYVLNLRVTQTWARHVCFYGTQRRNFKQRLCWDQARVYVCFQKQKLTVPANHSNYFPWPGSEAGNCTYLSLDF
jgi:hypothetical protein